MAVTPNGFLFTWGLNVHGQLGQGNFRDVSSPIPVLSLQKEKIVQISAGFMHSGAVTEDGELFMWGDNKDNRSFLHVTKYKKSGRIRNHATPQLIKSFLGIQISQLSCGTTHSLVLTKAGEVFAAGSNEYGQLGVKDFHRVHKNIDEEGKQAGIVQLRDFNEFYEAQKVCASDGFSIVLSKSGDVHTCGKGNFGRLGHGDERDVKEM
jgi:alpha-tubulin suppressor-like RCC1 family protein